MIKFKEYMNEAKDFIKEFEKLSGIKPDHGRNSDEKVFYFSDKSSIVINKNKGRIDYYDKDMEFVTSYTSPKQAHKAIDQSGLLSEAKMAKSSINKLAKVVNKVYNTGKLIDSEFTEDSKTPTLMLKFDKGTVVFMKSFDWADSVDMGVWTKTEYKKEPRIMDSLSNSDVIFYNKQNGAGSSVLLDEEVVKVARPLFGL